MSGSPLILGAAQRAALWELRERAAMRPVDVRGLAERLRRPEAKRAHMDQMNDQTVELPTAFLVTFSIEAFHPGPAAPPVTDGLRRQIDMAVEEGLEKRLGFAIGTPGLARHMSMSSERRGRTPTPHAVWMVAEALGFVGGLQDCVVWSEELQRGPSEQDRAMAVNVVQIIEDEGTTVERLQ